MTLGRQIGKDETGGRRGYDAGLAPKLGKAVTLPLHDARNGQIKGMHELTRPQFLALGELFGLLADLAMVTHRHCELLGEPFTLRLTESGRLRKAFLGLVAQGVERVPQCKELLFGLAH